MAKTKKAKGGAKGEKRFFVRDALDGGFWEIVDGKLARAEPAEVVEIARERQESFRAKLEEALGELHPADRAAITARLGGARVSGGGFPDGGHGI